MAWRFYRRKKILPGVTINISKSGPSVSVGRRRARFTVGPRGTRKSVGIPGTGLSYTTTGRLPLWLIAAIALLILALLLWSGCASQPQSRNQRLAADIQNDGFNTAWTNRPSCLEDSNFSPSVLSACLAQQPPNSNDVA
jgi:hypothetical protein